MTPTELMNNCADPNIGSRMFHAPFWTITQNELERFYSRAQAQALREAADRLCGVHRDEIRRMAAELEGK